MNRKNFYYFFSILATISWIYILFQISRDSVNFVFCPIKSITTLPCPACGSTRSVISILEGNFAEALKTNPLGYIDIIGLIIIPFWLATDLITKQETLYLSYRKIESYLNKKYVAIPLILLFIANWIWNITKDF